MQVRAKLDSVERFCQDAFRERRRDIASEGVRCARECSPTPSRTRPNLGALRIKPEERCDIPSQPTSVGIVVFFSLQWLFGRASSG